VFSGNQFCLSSFHGNETSCIKPAGSVLTPPRHTSSWRVPLGFTVLGFAIASELKGSRSMQQTSFYTRVLEIFNIYFG